MNRVLLIILFSFICFNLYAEDVNKTAFTTEQSFRLPKGTLSIGGNLLVIPAWNERLGHRLDIEVHPSFGYFVIDNLELQIGIFVQATPVSQVPELQGLLMPRWGMDGGLAYYFDCKKVFVFAAGRLGYRTMGKFFDNAIEGTLAGGVLVPLTSSLALSFEVPFQLSYEIAGPDSLLSYRIPLGFAGIRGYF